MPVDLTTMWLPSFPDSVARPVVRTDQQQATTALLPIPLSLAWVDGYFPDAVFRPRLATAAQQAAVPDPVPLSIAWVDGNAIFPDRLTRPSLQTGTVPSFAGPVSLERTAPLPWTEFPDALVYPRPPGPWQFVAPSLYPLPTPSQGSLVRGGPIRLVLGFGI